MLVVRWFPLNVLVIHSEPEKQQLFDTIRLS